MGLGNVLFGRKKLKGANLDKLFALSTAAITLETECNLKPAGVAAVVFKPHGGNNRIVIPVDAKHTGEERKQLEEDARDPFVMFEPVKPEELHVIFASREDPLTAERLQAVQATGVYVHGTRMSACREALCTDRGWIAHMQEKDMPYVGSAAGDRAIDLVFEPCCRFNGRQRCDAGRLVECGLVERARETRVVEHARPVAGLVGYY